MLRPDYGNLYKFIASVGLSSLAISLAVPLIVGRLGDGLFLTQTDVEGLAPPARELWELRTSMAQRAVSLWPYLSAAFAIAGLGATALGARAWREQQRISDALERTQLDRALLEVAEMSAPEIDAKAERDAVREVESAAEDIGPWGAPGDARPDTEALKRRILQAEGRVLFLLQASLRHSHEGRSHLRLQRDGRSTTVDALLKARDPAYRDVVAEVKYVRSAGRIAQYVTELALRAAAYTEGTRRDAVPLLIAVVATSPNDDRRAREIRAALKEAVADAFVSSMATAVLREHELETLEPDTFHAKLPPELILAPPRRV